jgi:hypothetical protein
MESKAGPRLYDVIVEYPERAKIHLLRILVAVEGKMPVAGKPVGVGAVVMLV